MEASPSPLTTGELSGCQEHCQPESPQRGQKAESPSQHQEEEHNIVPKPHGEPHLPKQSKRQNPEHKRLRHQQQVVDPDAVLENKEAWPTSKEQMHSSLSPVDLPSLVDIPNQSKSKTQEDNPKQKRERKPQRPGKYVCTYCGRACAKPSVLQKHIRSHTGERPYPCVPCGFSFKTKSNLYKHRKSHTHKVKAGLTLGKPKSFEEHVTESEDETRQLSSRLADRQRTISSLKSYETEGGKNCTGGNNDSYAVKKRLALRLSRGKHAPQESSDDKTSSLSLGSKGSTESGYFSLSESTDQSLDNSQNTSAKSYAEIILGKYGRLGHLEKLSRHHNQHPSGQEDKNTSFTVPKKHVIDHITKLITINEAVVDTSKLDSVKPRRFSLSRKSSSESRKGSSIKESLVVSPKTGDLGYKNTGSISMGVPCERFHNSSQNLEQSGKQISTASLVRSHSMPSAPSSYDASSGNSFKFRPSQSFDGPRASETQMSRYGTLRRQAAVEIPLGAEPTKEEFEVSRAFYPSSITCLPDHKRCRPQPYECEACGVGCKDWEGYKKHKQSLCLALHPQNELVNSQMDCSQKGNNAVRTGTPTVRKRRKEESFDFEDPSSPSLPSSTVLSEQCQIETGVSHKTPRGPAIQTCSVIQHTSTFEKQELSSHETPSLDITKNISTSPHQEYQPLPKKQPHHQSKLSVRKLVRQNNVRVPEILVTEDFNSPEASNEASNTYNLEKLDEFQWPQRSPSLSQLPIEKLPPKKKRLRLAEVAQSSGESSFDSISLPHTPSQDSSASYASSRSTSFEEPNRPEMETAATTPSRRSRGPHMLAVPGVHHHREMRRSASEQAPHDAQPSILIAESRSKSFDHSCLSPERSAAGWKERTKCLLMRHATIKDPDEEEGEVSHNLEHISTGKSSQANPTSAIGSRSFSNSTSEAKPLDSVSMFPEWKLDQNVPACGGPNLLVTHEPSVDVKKENSCIHPDQLPPQVSHPNSSCGLSGAARAHYLHSSTGLRLEIPARQDYSEIRTAQINNHHSGPHIISSLELLRPSTSTTVAVRLQTNTLIPACAIYTTLSRAMSPRPQEAVDAVSPTLGVSPTESRSTGMMSPDLQQWPDNGLRLSVSGGNKRMLSPSSSIELHPDSQQQQKRVKEEDKSGEQCTGMGASHLSSQELKQENPLCLPDVCMPRSPDDSSFPSLLSNTCNSWCYLNYTKPNPSALDEQKPSVYSSWSTSSYNPNPPGLSSRTALSLLHCKQRLSPSIYTTSPMSVRTTETTEQDDNKRPCTTEVFNSCCRDHEDPEMGRPSPEKNWSKQTEGEEEKSQEEEVQSCFRKTPTQMWVSQKGSNTLSCAVNAADRCRCEDLCKEAAGAPTDPPPCDWNPSCSSLAARASLGQNEEENIRCAVDTCKVVSRVPSANPDQQKDDRSSDLRNHAAHRGDEDVRLKSSSQDEDHDEPHPGDQPTESACGSSSSSPLVHKEPWQRSSASARRALFARRRLDASASQTSHFQTQNPQRGLSPPHTPSPKPSQPPSPPASLPSGFHQTPGSPARGPPSNQIQGPSDPQYGACPRPREHPSASTQLRDDASLAHITVQPPRLRGAINLLSHLPLHSQQSSRTLSLLIPIGGIHMIQPRSTLPLYSLRGSSRAPTPLCDSPKETQQAVLREASPSSRTAPPSPDSSHFDTRTVRLAETPQGQKQTPPCQTQL
ncbi:transcription factor HIVEP3 [Oryzias latipes]|uniref:HIVEP zinc finger 3a n=1 Tax=Oryzias latipes TaxID=8090 RepID=A0A3B3I176_ORYLA|nr:transcription factor HIVEP3 [Oryzias latipes]XP_023815769.1 transcription factor HIVEP3 [Oryzias latipes]XP_023815770.1 transcription factor HIVEP3 [Oryzias latipes]